MLLSYICQELYPDKTASGQPVNILKVWAGPGTLAAFDRRQEGYARYEEQGLIATVETIAPQSAAGTDAQDSMAQVAAQALARYEAGQIDAIWCCYDLYAGASTRPWSRAAAKSPWSALISATPTCPDGPAGFPLDGLRHHQLGPQRRVRYAGAALELAGEYDRIVDPASGEVSDWLEIPPFLVTQQDLSGADPTVADLTASPATAPVGCPPPVGCPDPRRLSPWTLPARISMQPKNHPAPQAHACGAGFISPFLRCIRRVPSPPAPAEC